MLSVDAVARELEALAPIENALEWDNVGVLVDCENSFSSVLCALDISMATVNEAARLGCGLIVSHHPVIHGGLKRISRSSPVFALIENNISAICMHTNLDAATGGVNDVLCGLLGLENTEVFEDLGRLGSLKEKTKLSVLAGRCRDIFGAGVRYGGGEREISRAAVMSGSGGSFWRQAKLAGAHCLITGEAGYHDALDAGQQGFPIIAAGHYATEQPVIPVLAKRLSAAFPMAKFHVSADGLDSFTYL